MVVDLRSKLSHETEDVFFSSLGNFKKLEKLVLRFDFDISCFESAQDL
jgi:hypothetical protein